MKLIRSSKSLNTCEFVLTHAASERIGAFYKHRFARKISSSKNRSLSLVLMSPKVGDSDYVYTRAKVLGFVKASRSVVF